MGMRWVDMIVITSLRHCFLLVGTEPTLVESSLSRLL